ncbi:MAG: radical SAM family heme chaperone HemW [Acidiferrobacter sp.]
MASPVPPPLCLYVHLPWCTRKCPYCDFHSLPQRGALPEAAYGQALLQDFAAAIDTTDGRPLTAIFFGGGTPSLFSPAAISAILAGIARRATLAPDCEITLEANPGTLEAGRFLAFREAGVTRLSLGVQSVDDGLLQRLGRVHDGTQARAAIAAAAGAGFRTFNLDLMYGLPGQTVAQADTDIDAVLAVAPPHLSLYELTIEPHTAFARRPPSLPDDETRATIETLMRARADAAGLTRYEISAFARPGDRCRHNLNYWEFGDYLGIGAGAHGKLTQGHSIVREVRTADPQQYMRAPRAGIRRQSLTTDDCVFEFLLNALRLTAGFAPALFTTRTGLAWEQATVMLAPAVNDGLLAISADRCRATDRGQRFLDSILAALLPATVTPSTYGEPLHALD